MHQIHFRLDSTSDPVGGAYSAPPDPYIAAFHRPTSKEREMGGEEKGHNLRKTTPVIRWLTGLRCTLTVDKVRIILRINIRILPVLTSAHPHIHASAFYPLPLSAPQFLVQSVVSRVAYRCFHFDDVTGQRQYYITITRKYQVDNLDSYY